MPNEPSPIFGHFGPTNWNNQLNRLCKTCQETQSRPPGNAPAAALAQVVLLHLVAQRVPRDVQQPRACVWLPSVFSSARATNWRSLSTSDRPPSGISSCASGAAPCLASECVMAIGKLAARSATTLPESSPAPARSAIPAHSPASRAPAAAPTLPARPPRSAA